MPPAGHKNALVMSAFKRCFQKRYQAKRRREASTGSLLFRVNGSIEYTTELPDQRLRKSYLFIPDTIIIS